MIDFLIAPIHLCRIGLKVSLVVVSNVCFICVSVSILVAANTVFGVFGVRCSAVFGRV